MDRDENAGLPGTEHAGGDEGLPTLDDIISGALDQQQAEPGAGTGEKAAGDKSAAADKGQQQDGQERDPATGKFKPKSVAADASQKTGAPDAAGKADQAQVPQQPGPEVQHLEPHARWDEARKATFKSLSDEAKKFALDVQAQNDAIFTRRSQDFADYKRTADPLMEAVKPYERYLGQVAQHFGSTPVKLISEILQSENILRTAPLPQKYAAFAQLAQAYGVDLAALTQGKIAQPDPLIEQQRREISQLRQQVENIGGLISQGQNEQLNLHIEAFASTKDEAGKPKYPHFQAVKAAMAQSLLDGTATTLEDAYNRATEPIRQAVAAELSTSRATEEQQRAEAVKKAQRAAPVRSSGTSPGGSVKPGDLDSVISGALDKAGVTA